mgnify:FL=1
MRRGKARSRSDRAAELDAARKKLEGKRREIMMSLRV